MRGIIMGPQRYLQPNPQNLWICCLLYGKGGLRLQKKAEEGLFWSNLIWPRLDHSCCLWRWRKRAKECRWLLETGKGKKMNSPPRASRKQCRIANTLIFVNWELFQTADFQNYKVINSCCFVPLNLRSFLSTPTEN